MRAPLVRDRSMAQQLLQSWAGQRLLASLGGVLHTDRGSAGPELYSALSSLLRRQEQVNGLELLRALPSRRVSLNLDGVLDLAGEWQRQLQGQRQALMALRRLPLPAGTALMPITDGLALDRGKGGGLAAETTPPRLLRL